MFDIRCLVAHAQRHDQLMVTVNGQLAVVTLDVVAIGANLRAGIASAASGSCTGGHRGLKDLQGFAAIGCCGQSPASYPQ